MDDKLKALFPESFLRIEVVGKTNYFLPYREALVESIRKLGFEARGFEEINYGYNPDGFLIINPLHYRNEEFRNRQFLYAGIQTEQLPNREVYCVDFGKDKYEMFRKYYHKYDFIFEWSPSSYRFLKERYKRVFFLPHCSFSQMEYADMERVTPEPYDLFFAGSPIGVRGRREKLLKALEERYRLYPQVSNLWGEEKGEGILSSKICLNIHFDHSLVFESPRIYEYLSNKKFVLSERMADSYPFVAGVDYGEFQIRNIFDRVDYYLSHDEERARIAENGHAKAGSFRLDDHVSIILDRFLMEKGYRMSRREDVRKALWPRKTGFQRGRE